jgi:voltage-gated potassium channel
VTATSTAPVVGSDDAALRAAKLLRWERRTSSWIIVSALLPIAMAFAPRQSSTLSNVVNVVCWLVFLVDLLVHLRLSDHYLRKRRGKFDLTIVIITAPWFLFTGGASQFVVLARLARLGRVIMASSRSNKLKHLVNQLGNVAIYALGLLLACSFIVFEVEPASSGFTTFGDAVWWGFVTITTVGYGDLTPVTAVGRTAAVILMLGGVAFLGTLAGTLSAFFGVGSDGKPVEYDDHGDVIVTEEVAAVATTELDVATELAALRETVAALAAKLDSPTPPGA